MPSSNSSINDNTVVEWRVFFPETAIEGIPLPFFTHPPLLTSLAAPAAHGGEIEERTDSYTAVSNEAVGLKHRGKKGKLEVKVRLAALPPHETGNLLGMEAWTKYKLGKGSKGLPLDEVSSLQLVELEQVLKTHRLFDDQAHAKLKEGQGAEIQVEKRRVVSSYTDTVLIEAGGGNGSEEKDGKSLASQLWQGLGLGRGGDGERGGWRVSIEVLVEDCLLDVRGLKGVKKSQWRSFAVEGKKADVQAFLSATKMGRWMYGGAQQDGVLLKGYPGFLLALISQENETKGDVEEKKKEKKKEGGHKAKEQEDGDVEPPHVCPVAAAAVAALTASTTYPIPPLPANPYRGIKEPCQLKQISLVVVRHPTTGKFLAVEEAKNKGWWLPAGHVDPDETFQVAAYRETLEEAGIGVRLTGLLRIEHKLTGPSKGRLRVVFFGVPIHPDAPVKSVADEESVSARWVTVDDLKRLPLRNPDLLKWAEYLEKGGAIYPLHVLAGEGEPIPSK